jgi:protein-S-isoprenylcysteine O-methyltransferase Ste14
MADGGRARRLAETIARRRVSAGFLLGVVALWLSDPTPRTLGIGAAIAVAGEAVRLWAAGHLEKGREVTSSGPYAMMRHPLYFGSSLIGAGMAIASASLVVAAVIAAYLAVTVTAAIRAEEAHLADKFGDQYLTYRDGGSPGVERRFSLARAMRNREYRAMSGLALLLALLAWKAWH